MIIFGSTLSPYVRKTAAFASEKGLEFEIKPTGLGSPDPDFCAASPFRKMPAFQDGDYRLCDSTAICHYLEAKYPDRPLIPAEPEARGRTIWYDEFADTILVACGAKVFFNRIVAPRFLGQPGDESAAETALRDELPPILDYLEKVVPDPGGYLVGDALTLADLAVASPFANFFHLNVELDSERHPRTRAYTESILARPSFRPFIEKEAALLERTAA
ncbi:glutathione S-transferase family protein [Sphingomonas sp. SM33]|uniref:Glutathione S-transferase family protein n=1 Tax=Sphingomonas telluris TaxID=2907998 RepID=A0ABS9VL16_9SPHN|nr:glutathione S-transferase family protein [Sphingomonas telluris]MCH8615667.1 glutathione S-transferase family protein [Sphingomonas telluris]